MNHNSNKILFVKLKLLFVFVVVVHSGALKYSNIFQVTLSCRVKLFFP